MHHIIGLDGISIIIYHWSVLMVQYTICTVCGRYMHKSSSMNMQLISKKKAFSPIWAYFEFKPSSDDSIRLLYVIYTE